MFLSLMSFSFVSFLHLSLSLSPQVLFCFCSYLLQHFFPSQSCSFSHQDLPSCHYFTAKCQYYGFLQSLILYHLLFVVVLVPVADMFVVMPRFTWKELSFSVSRSEFYCFIDLLTVPGDTFVVMFVSEPDLLILPMILAIFLYLVPNIVIFFIQALLEFGSVCCGVCFRARLAYCTTNSSCLSISVSIL